MALYGGFDVTKHFDELDSPLVAQDGVLTPAVRRARCLVNMGVTSTAAELNVLDSVVGGTVLAASAVVVDASKDLSEFGHVTGLGFQHVATARTATSTGLTTGLIASNTGFVTVTSSSSTNVCVLPTAIIGMYIQGWVGANGFALETLAATSDTINDVDASGTKQALVPATSMWQARCVTATGWILTIQSELAVDVVVVPA